jgi:hypothetical protein
MGRNLRTRKKVDYAKVVKKYDKESFISLGRVRFKPARAVGAPGRARAAPPLTSWSGATLHGSVQYFDDIDNSLHWAITAPNDVKLPFRLLDVGDAGWQGLEQQVNMGGDVNARAHFDAITAKMRIAPSNPTITECVGEAAAAICVIDAGGWEMIWGFHLHSGTGIDQIWRRPAAGGKHDYMIVEAKGPGASVNASVFVPQGYSQMELGWVVNHLNSMNNNHAIGQQMVADLNLSFTVAHANYGGATKSYYGLAPGSRHATSGCHLYGCVVEAAWLSDGRLGYNAGPVTTYF